MERTDFKMVETDSESDPDKALEVESMANLRVINKEFCRMLIYTEIFKSHADYLLLLKYFLLGGEME